MNMKSIYKHLIFSWVEKSNVLQIDSHGIDKPSMKIYIIVLLKILMMGSLKEKIIKLEVTVSVQQMELTKQSMEIRKLQAENYFLRHHVPPETLVQLFNQQIPFTEDNLDFNIQLQRNNFE